MPANRLRPLTMFLFISYLCRFVPPPMLPRNNHFPQCTYPGSNLKMPHRCRNQYRFHTRGRCRYTSIQLRTVVPPSVYNSRVYKEAHQRGLSLDFRRNILATSDSGQFLIPAAWPMNHSPISSGCSYLAQPHFVLIIRIRIAGGRELIFLVYYVRTAACTHIGRHVCGCDA